MKKTLIFTLIFGCVLTSFFAFADVITLGGVSHAPGGMLILGFGLLGLAGISKSRI